MKFSLETLNNNIQKVQFKVKKNSPLILVTAGVLGLGLTAYEAYKSRDKVRAIVEDVEEKRENGEDVNMRQVATDLAVATAKPILYGTLSVGAILGSYHVLTNRVHLLSTALATATAENTRIKNYIRKNHPEVITAPVSETEEVFESRDDEGKKKRKTVVAVKKQEVGWMEGVWFDKSTEYASDDNTWNETLISTQAHVLSNMKMGRGYLRLSEVLQALNIPKSEYNPRAAETLGWFERDYFDLDIQFIRVSDGEGYSRMIPYVSWPAVRSIVDAIDHSEEIANYYY